MASQGQGDDQSSPRGGKVGKHPTDLGKIGINRSVLPDGGVMLLGLAAGGADRHDFEMIQETITRSPVESPAPYAGAAAGEVFGQQL